jgi:uncharacterized membrane protein YdjX (TVP38/TMEM64 family)
LNLRILTRGLVLIATFAAAGYAMKASGLHGVLDTAWIDSEIRGKGLSGELLYVAVGAVAVAVGLPRQLVCFLGGYAFGFAVGTALALVASIGGCVLAFYYARLMGRELIAAKFPHRIKKIDDFLRDYPLSMTLLIRLLPVGSNLVTNLAAGVSGVQALYFIAGSGLGYIPQTAVFALLGSGININPELRISLSVALFVASAVLGVWLYRRFRHGKALDEETERALEMSEQGKETP